MRKITGNSNGKHGRTTTTDRLRRRRRTAFQPPKETLSVVWLKGISSSSAAPCYPLGPRNFHLLCDIAESCLSERSAGWGSTTDPADEGSGRTRNREGERKRSFPFAWWCWERKRRVRRRGRRWRRSSSSRGSSLRNSERVLRRQVGGEAGRKVGSHPLLLLCRGNFGDIPPERRARTTIRRTSKRR